MTRHPRPLLRCALALVVSSATLVETVGCVSSSTWSDWHAARARIDEIEEETSADASEVATVTGHPLAFGSCEDVVRTAVAAYPGLAAPRERARAALAMARAEGALPAPSITATVWDFPIGEPSMADREGMYMLGVAQELPPPDSLDASARAAVEEARAALGELEELRREVASGAAHACADWAGAAWLHARLLVWIGSLQTMRDAVGARYSAAGGSLADVARVERELATAERMIARTSSDEERAMEALRARFGLPRSTSLGAAPPLATTVTPLDGDAVLDYALERRGALAAGRASIAAAEARARAAEARASVPTFMFGTMYMQTPQARAGLGLEFGMTLPWLWSGEPDLAEAARAEASAAEADVAGLERMIEIDVRTALAELETTRRVLDTLREREAPAAALALEATIATYGAGEGTLLDWLDAARAIRELEIEEAELLADVAHARAEVASAIGATLGELDASPLAVEPGPVAPSP